MEDNRQLLGNCGTRRASSYFGIGCGSIPEEVEYQGIYTLPCYPDIERQYTFWYPRGRVI